MSLLATKHNNRESAALSITGNRASKVRLLRGEDPARPFGVYDEPPRGASRNELELYRDVLAFIADEQVQSATFYRQLANMALSALPADND